MGGIKISIDLLLSSLAKMVEYFLFYCAPYALTHKLKATNNVQGGSDGAIAASHGIVLCAYLFSLFYLSLFSFLTGKETEVTRVNLVLFI